MAIGLLFLTAFVALAAFGIRHALRKMRERQQLQAQHPGQPWMWRHDWADRAIHDEEAVQAGFLWAFGLLWLVISLPALYVLRANADRDRIVMIFFALFPIAGIGVWSVAAYLTLRRRKYGASICNLQRVPVAVGSTFRGEVQARVREIPEHGLQVRLACVRRIVRSTGKGSSTREVVLWQDEQTVGSGAAMPHPEGMRIPVQFAIPPDCEPTDDSNRRDSILWRLEVRADVPGIDYLARFALPVFRTDEKPDTDYWPTPATPSWNPPPNILIQPTRSGGEEIVVKPVTPFGDWLGYLFFIVLWYTALFFFSRFGIPIFVLVFFGAFGALVFLAAADLLLGRSVISADRQALTARRGWFGLGKTRTFPADTIEEIVARVGNTTGNLARYDVEMHLREGKPRRIAKHLRNRRDADGVAARLWRALGH